MQRSLFRITLCGALAAFSAVPVFAADGLAVTIDGFAVQKRTFPTQAVARRPEFKSGTVYFGTNAPGQNPYIGTVLDGSPFLSLEIGNAVYLLRRPAKSVSFIWGTPDPWNNVIFYGANGKKLGTLTGVDMEAAFGQSSNNFYRITASAPIGTVIATSTECCFEIAQQTMGPPAQ